jgi:F0F1-type ATP synthase assembly protein I
MTRDRKGFVDKFGVAYTLAIEMAVAVIAPILIGRWLDGKTGMGPWFTLGGVVLGGAAAIRSAYRTMIELQKDQRREAQQPPEDSNNREEH